ncbi:hypothetical protein Bhyg_07674 [Pseudolycoriella hygida]|uniref:Uncharacterized protein n=1 Tax=Pseudolycoriella hygida TaxID=35572 RepID=A0A9Q0S469_9DIPT|nr:hypothetical protein Bhyg_07674 [Pseudolycoriella hygida]
MSQSKMTDTSTGASEKTTVTKKQTELKSGDSVTLAGDATDEPEDVEINVEFDDDDEPSNINFLPEERRNGCDNTNMKIPTWDQGPKKYFRVYCMKRVSKLVRHLSTVHKNEDESDPRETHSSSMEYQASSSHSVPSQIEEDTQKKDRQDQVNYFHENSTPPDQVTECDTNATSGRGTEQNENEPNNVILTKLKIVTPDNLLIAEMKQRSGTYLKELRFECMYFKEEYGASICDHLENVEM